MEMEDKLGACHSSVVAYIYVELSGAMLVDPVS